MGMVPYHLDLGEVVLSLEFANPDPAVVQKQREQYENNSASRTGKLRTEIQKHSLKRHIHCLYTAELFPPELPDDYDEGLSDAEQVLVDTVLYAFTGVKERCESRGEPLQWYKKPDFTEIVSQFERVQWRQSVPEVAGNLLSNLILGHPLPNANHRTAISVVRTYLESVAPEVEAPKAGTDQGAWHSWANDYIRESKRLLTLRRNATTFHYLEQWGCSTVVRKGSIEIELSNRELNVADPHSHFGRLHQKKSTEFVIELIKRAGKEELLTRTDDGKSAFISRLR
ncbi:hypothetical protein [Halorussus aquaticus]|uniref:Fido domain-containing protein n=1 Tax=Halorussus aquaticus TaxID=2953748 RepID=A0ABD5Q1Z8_9EURY|nr:hypothetical protein [Halorussus aquaticus]